MKETQIVLSILCLLAIACYAQVSDTKIVCYYDSGAINREDQAKFETSFLTEPVKICSYLIYGYAGINKKNYKLESLNYDYDIVRNNFKDVTNLKRNNPDLRILLSVGGGKDDVNPEKYLDLLESTENRKAFVSSATSLLKTYGFDGLDLAWQFPTNKPKEVRGPWSKAWIAVKNVFADSPPVDSKAQQHNEQFISLVSELKNDFKANNDKLILSLSVLPNVNSGVYYNVNELIRNLDFVNLWAFDYYTPNRNPKEADYPAPLYIQHLRRDDENANYLVQYWIQQGAPTNKLFLGIPTFGRSWLMTHESGTSGIPPVTDTHGVGKPGPFTKEKGLLSYQEVCEKISKPDPFQPGNPYKKSEDPAGIHGVYAFQHENDFTKIFGTWIGYEDPAIAAVKAAYARTKGLGGLAIVDLTLDDFRGSCSAKKYPILNAVKNGV